MTKIEKQKMIEVILYILNKTGGLDYYHLFKILYFANQRSLVDWGHPMTGDQFCALPHGPVPTGLYNTIKGERMVIKDLPESVDINEYFLLPKRDANIDYLSDYDIETLDECIPKYANMSFSELEKTSHTACWEKAREKPGRHVIELVDIARDGGASESLIQYINETTAFDEACRC